MSLSEFLDMKMGATLAFAATWIIAVLAYRQNKRDHQGLGDKVDASADSVKKSIEKLGDKVDAVREIISQHETHWHAPITRKTTPVKRAAKKDKELY